MAHQSRDGSPHVPSAPVHPVAQLQGPFDESMLESTYDQDDGIYPDPVTRRNTLLESPTYVRVVAGRWKQRPGEHFHPLWKLIAQISFGVHLLAEGMARSEDDVMQILQAHVDEIDGFLERTTEDFDLAQEDIQERLRCLKLPLSHPATFDKMLEDRNFRLSIVDGNEKIEHIVDRTTQAMKDSMKDVQKGYESTTCLETYLQNLALTWNRLSVEHEAVFVAMLGNVEGWRKAFSGLHNQGTKLNNSLKKLTDIINEMQARAGEVSRRLLHQAKVQPSPTTGRPSSRNTPTSRFATTPKQLPGMPVRPPLKQASSNDTVSSTSSMRSPSHENLRRQAMLSRSQTPQRDTPSPQFVQRSISPQIVDIGNNSQARVQSVVPSLIGVNIPSEERRASHQGQPSADIRSTKYFPPVELPAHVPEETMQNVPMSKQNRLSMGLNAVQGKVSARLERRNSRIGTSALIDLLRAGPPSSSQKSRSPEASRRGSAVKLPSIPDDSLSEDKGVPPLPAPSARSVSMSDTIGSHTKNNIRRPKKGVKHWFDAVDDDDSNDDDKYSLVSDERATSVAITVKPSHTLNHDSQPGTPAWAVTTFAQAEKRKELLKQGAFRSHPPEMPLGSPPVTQSKTFPNPLGVNTPQRRPSHASSTGQSTLGEPGPEIALSEAGSVSAHSGRQKHNDVNRTSAYAPEVVMEELPPLPPPKKEFIAEMEGSNTQLSAIPSTGKVIIMELEAPRHHFELPPRPETQAVTQSSASPRPHQQHFVLPPRPQQTPPSQPSTPYQQHFVLPPRPQIERKPVPVSSRVAEPLISTKPERELPATSEVAEAVTLVKPERVLPATPDIGGSDTQVKVERELPKTPEVVESITEAKIERQLPEIPQVLEPSVEVHAEQSQEASKPETTENQVPDNKQPEQTSVKIAEAEDPRRLSNQSTTSTHPLPETAVREVESNAESVAALQLHEPAVEVESIPEDVQESQDVTEQFARYEEGDGYERLPSSVYVPTPSIPIPPSPFGDAAYLQANESQRESKISDSLYILPAIAYKAPHISPRLPPDPVTQHQMYRRTEPKVSNVLPNEDITTPLTKAEDDRADAKIKSVEAERQSVPDFQSSEGLESVPLLSHFDSEEIKDESIESLQEPRNAPLEPTTAAVLIKAIPPPATEEYDPFRAVDMKPEPPRVAEPVRVARAPKIAPIKVDTTMNMNEGRRLDSHDDKVEGTSNLSGQGSTDEWKAFFKGQASPVGSTLSIRSIRRESYMEQPQQSPALLSPTSATSRHPFPPSPVGSTVKESVWFNVGNKRGSNASAQPREPVGLGILTLVEGEKLPVGAS